MNQHFYRSLILLVFLLCYATAHAQNFLWKETFKPQNATSSVHVITDHGQRAMVIDRNGNTYITGFLSGTVKFGNHLLHTPEPCLFVAKINIAGNVEWVKKSTGSNASGTLVALDGQDNLYVAGHFMQGTIGIENSILQTTASFTTTNFIIKYSSAGQLMWAKVVVDNGFGGLDLLHTDTNGNFYISGANAGSTIGGTIRFPGLSGVSRYIAKFNNSGIVQWAKEIRNTGDPAPPIKIKMTSDPSGNAYVAGSFSSDIFIDNTRVTRSTTNPGSQDVFLVKFAANGTLSWIRKSEHVQASGDVLVRDLTSDQQGNPYLLVRASSIVKFGQLVLPWGDIATYTYGLIRYDTQGNALWLISQQTADLFDDEKNRVKVDATGNIYIKTRLDITMYGANRAMRWRELIAANAIDLHINTQGIVRVAGISPQAEAYLQQITPGTIFSSTISGNIYEDINNNCLRDPGERGIADMFVKAEPGNYFAKTDQQGNYTLYVAPGTYTLSQVIPVREQRLISQSCAPGAAVSVAANQQQQGFNFGNKVTNCSLLTVDISSNRRRRCFRSVTTVRYANEGYADAANVQIKVIYPQYVKPITSSRNWTGRQDSVLIFDIGSVPARTSGSFVITDSVICGNEAIRGLTQCTKATISPAGSCRITNPNWDNASIEVFSSCIGNSMARLSILNNGSGNMRDSVQYRIFFDAVLKQTGKVKLNSGQKYDIEVNAKGRTIRLETDQVAFHPEGNRPTTTIENCGSRSVTVPTNAPPFFNQLPQDRTETMASSCMEIRDSYDPNDKHVFPSGVTDKKLVKEGTELEFLIRFQNTGTDEAYTVVVKDTLHDALDISTLQSLGASHSYKLDVSGKGNPVLTWTFDNINLAAAKVNEPASHGFIKFRIGQKPGTPKGTQITNRVGIYFDFNSPIITNQTMITIGDLPVDLNNVADVADIGVLSSEVITAKGDTLKAPTGGSGYQWFLNDQPISGASGQQFIANAHGVYTVKFTRGNVQYTTPAYRHVLTATEDEAFSRSIRLFPNPGTGVFKVQFESELIGEGEILIYNALGKQVEQVALKRNQSIQELNLSHLPQGVYLVHVRAGAQVAVKRVVIGR